MTFSEYRERLRGRIPELPTTHHWEDRHCVYFGDGWWAFHNLYIEEDVAMLWPWHLQTRKGSRIVFRSPHPEVEFWKLLHLCAATSDRLFFRFHPDLTKIATWDLARTEAEWALHLLAGEPEPRQMLTGLVA